MILYNITISLDPSIDEVWLKWMRETHIPEILETGCFTEGRLSKINGVEDEGITYSIMYLSPSQELFNRYQEEFASDFFTKQTQLFNGKFGAFRTVLNVIEEFKYER
jgi:hypothetical protein